MSYNTNKNILEMNSKQTVKVLVLLVLVSLPSLLTLQFDFYQDTCPVAEAIVRQAVRERFNADKTVVPALIRMYFHDCFVKGCDASLLLDSTPTNQAEKDAFANLSVREYNLIDQIKSELELACPGTVSCADIVSLATRDVVFLGGGPNYNVPLGRRDGLISRANEVDLPGPGSTVAQARQSFSARGLTESDMVVLLAGHSVGVTHCSLFRDRISNFQGSGAPDPSMDPALLQNLKNQCGSGSDPTVFLDGSTPNAMDNGFYKEIMNRRGVLQVDQELAMDNSTSVLVKRLANEQSFFKNSFAKAMVKLGSVNALEGNAGEIRTNCRVVNAQGS